MPERVGVKRAFISLRVLTRPLRRTTQSWPNDVTIIVRASLVLINLARFVPYHITDALRSIPVVNHSLQRERVAKVLRPRYILGLRASCREDDIYGRVRESVPSATATAACGECRPTFVPRGRRDIAIAREEQRLGDGPPPNEGGIGPMENVHVPRP